jgi:hypothetical protein
MGRSCQDTASSFLLELGGTDPGDVSYTAAIAAAAAATAQSGSDYRNATIDL